MQSPTHVKQRRRIHTSCACIFMRKTTRKKDPKLKMHLRRTLVHKVKGQTQKSVVMLLLPLLLLLLSLLLLLLFQLQTISLPCSFLVGCEVQWAPFPHFIRANVMSQGSVSHPSLLSSPPTPSHPLTHPPSSIYPSTYLSTFSLPCRHRVIASHPTSLWHHKT